VFANTLTVTIGGVGRVMNRVNQDNYGSEYKFVDAVELILMKIRHTTDIVNGVNVNRHNVFFERTVFATPTVVEKYWSCTATIRDAEGSGPTDLLATWQGFNTLLLTLDDGLTVGEN